MATTPRYMDKFGLEYYHNLIKKGLIEYIVGTQTEETNAWTGVSKSPSLFAGKVIIYHLPFAGTGAAATLNLTLTSGATTGAKAVQNETAGAVTTEYAADSDIFMVYTGSVWKCSAVDTTYAPLNNPEFTGTPTAPTAEEGTRTTQIATTEFTTAAVAAEAETRQAADSGLAAEIAAEKARVDSLVLGTTTNASGWNVETLTQNVTVSGGSASYNFTIPADATVLEVAVRSAASTSQPWITDNVNVYTNGTEAYVQATNLTDTNVVLKITYGKQGTIDLPELTDIRLGADGTTYPTAGDAVRGQISDVKEDLSECFTKVIGTNLLDRTVFTEGALQSNGTIATNGSYASYATSDFIELIPNTDYTYCIFYDGGTTINNATRKIVLLYDTKNSPVSSSFISQTGVDSVSFNSEDHKFARVSWVKIQLPQLEIGTNVTKPFREYKSTLYMETLLGDASLNQIAEVFPVNSSVRKEKNNLHEADTDVIGIVMSNGRIDTNATSYKTSDYIKLKSGQTYKISLTRKFCIYDIDKILSTYTDVSPAAERSYTAEADCYLRFSYPISTASTTVTSVYEGDFVYKIEETVDFSERQKEMIQNAVDGATGRDPLNGKKWAVLGDSFTNGATDTRIESGKYAGQKYVYPYLIGNRTGIDVISFFGGGRTLAFPANPDTFVNSVTCPTQTFYFENIPSDVDYITIYLGINDEHHSSSSSGGDGEDNTGIIPIGTIDDSTTATYLGAWNVVLTWLITNRPNAHIGMIVTNGIANKDQYRQGQIAIAEKYGIPYIDLNGDSRTPAMLRTSNPNISADVKTTLINKWAVVPGSNTHPNDAAHEFESYPIEAFLRSL